MKEQTIRVNQIIRNRTIITKAIAISKYRTQKNLAEKLEVPESTFNQWLTHGTLRAVDLARIVYHLKLDDKTVRALLGSKEKCLYDD